MRARHLGLYYGPGPRFVSCTVELVEAGRRALFALLPRLDACSVWSPGVRLQCFETRVRAVLSYGSELWGPDKVIELLRITEQWPVGRDLQTSVFDRAMKDPAVRLQWLFLKRCAGVKTAPRLCVFRELGQWPLHVFWLRMACQFWNRLVRGRSTPNGKAYYDVFRYDLELAEKPGFAFSDLWCAKMLLVLSALGYVWGTDSPRCEQLLRVRDVVEALEVRLGDAWAPFQAGPVEPRGFTGSDLSLCVFENWMGAPTGARDCPARAAGEVRLNAHPALAGLPLVLGGNVFGWSTDEAQGFEVLDAFVKHGGNFIDTANFYTRSHSEKIIGDHIGRHPARRDRG